MDCVIMCCAVILCTLTYQNAFAMLSETARLQKRTEM
uniref:Uncharacterized protein n=1 Tax=Phakopsora pachyrhizi TaxID=170000 RepID=A0A0S1MK33_PHAPC